MGSRGSVRRHKGVAGSRSVPDDQRAGAPSLLDACAGSVRLLGRTARHARTRMAASCFDRSGSGRGSAGSLVPSHHLDAATAPDWSDFRHSLSPAGCLSLVKSAKVVLLKKFRMFWMTY